MKIEITDKLYKNISDYCVLNNLNIDEYTNDLLKKSFTIDKYGERPPILAKQPIQEPEEKPAEENPEVKPVLKPKANPKPKKEKQVEQPKPVVIKVDPLEDEKPEVVKPKRRKLS